MALNRGLVTSTGSVFAVQVDGLAAGTASRAVPFINRVENGSINRSNAFLSGGAKSLAPGERVFMTELDVKEDRIRIGVLTADTSATQSGGRTRQTRYRATIDFMFERSLLASMDLATARRAIEGILQPQGAAGQTRTVELGQTLEQVEAMFGKPLTVVKLADKVIHTYKDIKITFVDGRVADVQ